MSANAFNLAIARAAAGLTWAYPCLIWVADYLLDETGTDYAKGWRGISWDEQRARSELANLALTGDGKTAVECAMDAMAKVHGWPEADAPMQGAVMVGVYTAPDDDVGVPAIFDGNSRWLIAGTGRATITKARPERMWQVPEHWHG